MQGNDKGTQILDLLVKSLKVVQGGMISINIEGQPALKIDVNKEKDKINIDFIQPSLLKVPEDETGLFDKLKTAKEFAQRLTDNGLTLSFLRKGKEAIILGLEADPKLSKLVTRSDDIEVDSLRESIKLGRELKEVED